MRNTNMNPSSLITQIWTKLVEELQTPSNEDPPPPLNQQQVENICDATDDKPLVQSISNENNASVQTGKHCSNTQSPSI